MEREGDAVKEKTNGQRGRNTSFKLGEAVLRKKQRLKVEEEPMTVK